MGKNGLLFRLQRRLLQVLVERVQAGALAQFRQDQARMPAAAKGAIYIDTIGALAHEVERIDRFI